MSIAAFEAQQADLTAALQRLASVSTNSKTAPILSHVLFEVRADNTVKMTATDLGTCAITTIDAVVETPGSFTMPAAVSLAFTSKLPRGSLVAVSCNDEDQITIGFGRSTIRPSALSVEDFPEFATDTFDAEFNVPSAGVRRALAKTISSASQNEAQYYLKGVYLHPVDGKFTCVATDGKRFALASVPMPAGIESFPGVIIPSAVVSDIAKLCDGDGDVLIQISETKSRFSAGRTSITTKVIDAKYPDYQRIVPTENTAKVSVDAREFMSAIDRVVLLASEKIRSVRMEIADDTMVLTLPRSDFGDAREELHCSYDGPPLNVGFASVYLAGVSKLVEAEDLDMFFDAEQPAEKPLICRDASDPSALFMITPYRM
jgi:DNA polymerase-3 subunit beta